MDVGLELLFGLAAVCLTLLGCTWKISGKIAGMDTSLKINIERTEDTHALLATHARECDLHRVKLEATLDHHAQRLDGLGG